MKGNKVAIMLATAVAMVVLSSLAASAAQATVGPLWIVGSTGKPLGGETRAITSKSVSTTFVLKGAVNIVCTKVEGTGFLLGGNPGTDYNESRFTGCAVEGKTVAECGAEGVKPVKAKNPGEVIVDSLTVLTYPDGTSRTSALDAFAPEGEAEHPNLFVEFEISGTNCIATLKNLRVRVEAIGSTITIKGVERKCGLLAEVGKLGSSNQFILTVSGEVAENGALNLPATALKEAELLETGTENFKLIKCELESDHATATEVGLSEVKTAPAEAFGWNT